MLAPGIWPILDYDTDPDDVISSLSSDRPKTQLPERAVLAILGEQVGAYAEAHSLAQVGLIDLVTVSYPVYLTERAGRQVAIVEAPIGAPAAVMVAEYLAQRGVKIAVAVGSCGALRAFPEGTFLVPNRALRDEGTSYHYLPPSSWVQTDPGVRAACQRAVAEDDLRAVEVDVWTTDGFYRETPALIDRRLGQGCAAVEMECAALSAWAQFRQVRFGQILFTADSLAGAAYDRRDFGVGSHELALQLAIAAAFAVQ